MTRKQAENRAREYVIAIRSNVEDMYADRIAFDVFRERNRALWDAVQADPAVDAIVARMLNRGGR